MRGIQSKDFKELAPGIPRPLRRVYLINPWIWRTPLWSHLQGKKIERPQILKHRPKIFRPKTKAAKAGPGEADQGEAGPSSDGLESVPLDYTEEPGLSADEAEKAEA